MYDTVACAGMPQKCYTEFWYVHDHGQIVVIYTDI